MYKLTKEDKVISSSKIAKLVIGYIVVTLMCLAIPYFNKYLIDNALNQNSQITVQILISILISIGIIQLLIFYLGNYINSKYFILADQNIKKLLLEATLKMNNGDYSSVDKTKILNLFLADSGNAASAILNYRVFRTACIMQIVVILLVLFVIQVRLALIAMIFIPLYVLAINLNVKKIAEKNYNQILSQDKFVRDVKSFTSFKEDINAFSVNDFISDKFNESLEVWTKNRLQYSFWTTLIKRIPLLISSIAPIAILWFGSYQIRSGQMSLGTLIMFSQVTAFLFEPLSSFSQIVTESKAFKPYFDRLETYLYHETQSDRKYEDLFHDIEFFLSAEKISLYTPMKELLFKGSFRFSKKGFIIIKGANGSGKSSLFRLILGRHQHGQLVIEGDGHFTIDKSFREGLSVLSYPLFIFEGTIKENIYFDKDIEYYHLSDDIDLPPLEKTIDGNIGNLSSGERQKIALARVIFNNKDCILLDEPTSNLEKAAIESLKKWIKTNKHHKLIISIMHDHSFDDISDEIYNIENKIITKV